MLPALSRSVSTTINIKILFKLKLCYAHLQSRSVSTTINIKILFKLELCYAHLQSRSVSITMRIKRPSKWKLCYVYSESYNILTIIDLVWLIPLVTNSTLFPAAAQLPSLNTLYLILKESKWYGDNILFLAIIFTTYKTD